MADRILIIAAIISCYVLVTFSQVEDSNQNNVFYRRQFTCPTGWIQRCNRCFRYIDQERQWPDAQYYCRRIGGDLVTIKDTRTLIFVTRVARWFSRGFHRWHRTFWIGANDRRIEGSFEWSDGTPASPRSFRYFGRGQPDDEGPGEDCVEMYARGRRISLWNDHQCRDELPFMCQMDACTEGQFRCDNGKCLTKYAVCDKVNDCGDNSDENQCKDHCGGKLEGTAGNFTSPSYPYPYPDNSDCTWHITVPLKHKIELTFDFLQLETGFDFIYVYDGPTMKSRLLMRVHGPRIPKPILSSGSQLVVRFQSDDSYQMKGFFARFKAIAEACGGSISLNPGQTREIMTPKYPMMYPASSKCVWKITTTEGTELAIQFNDFETEPINDLVDVRDGITETDHLLARLSGAQRGKAYLTTGSKLFVKFSSDFATSRRGFKALIRAGCNLELNVSHGVITSPGFGYGKYPNLLRCVWQITEPYNRSIAMIFHHFDTEKYFDTVDVEKGPEKKLAGRYSGDISRGSSNAWSLLLGSIARVTFRSDYSYRRSGFNLTFSIGCPKLELPSNGYLSTSDVHYGTTVEYSCKLGYKLMNGKSKKCMFRGVWTMQTPKCQEIICGPPGKIEHGWTDIQGGFNYNSNVTYSCLGGYELNGTRVRRCQKDGTWSGVLPTCIAVGCGDPGTPANGQRTGNSTNVGAILQFTCNVGYKLSGLEKMTCQADGKWSGQIPVCDPIFCSVPSPPKHGKIVVQPNSSVPLKIRFGQVVRFSCNNGFRLNGSQAIICQANSTFNRTGPSCLDIDECKNMPCKGPGAQCVNTLGSFKCYCEKGYKKMSPTLCQDVNECLVDNGLCSHNCSNLPGTYKCSCRDGYYLYTDNDGIVPESIVNHTCLGVKCAAPPALQNGTRSSALLRHPNKMVTLCSTGFIRIGPKMINCLTNGSWSGPFANCTAVDCGDPGLVKHATKNFNGSGLGSVATYNCSPGYFLVPGRRECIANETHSYWNGTAPVCKRKDCGKQSTPNGESVYQNGTLYGDKVIYSCNPGFMHSGSNESFCQTNGNWSSKPGICTAESCPDPGIPKRGRREGILSVGQTVKYSCIPGFPLQGDMNRTCRYENETTKIWTGKLPVCKDILPPSFGSTCPNSTTVTLVRGESHAFGSWLIPTATDNSGKRPVVTVHPNVYPPAKLSFGMNRIIYRAVDQEGNEQNCTFTITVKDVEPPRVSCPMNFNITSDFNVSAFWGGGSAKDNIGVANISFNPPNGTRFLSNSKNKVIMTAVDTSGNNASCFFQVNVKGCGCPNMRTCNIQPRYGYATCHLNIPPLTCTVVCENGYTFADRTFDGSFLNCPSNKWVKQVPRCIKKEAATACYKIRIDIHYPSITTPLSISYRERYQKFEKVINFISANSRECDVVSRTGLTPMLPNVGGTILHRSYRLDSKGILVNGSTDSTLLACIAALNASLIKNETYLMNQVGSYSVTDNVASTGIRLGPSESCCGKKQTPCCLSANNVLVKAATSKESFCYPCSPGTFYNATSNNCEACGMHTYQNTTGQTSCLACPAGTGTLRKSSSECIDECKTGTFSSDGYGPICRPCSIGEYQPSMKSTDCLKCPAGNSTIESGASSVNQCIAQCPAGQISKSGFSPCDNCPVGMYQPNIGRSVCYPCPGGGKFGGQAGAVNISECPTNDSCYASPCKNNGTCTRGASNYICECKEGFAGMDCEIDINECASNPCQNNGSCTDLVNAFNCSCVPGFTGQFCEVNINECAQQCRYGTCIDGINSFTCICKPGFVGKLCDVETNECDSTPCQNNGSCLDLVNAYHCLCRAGYEGKNCQNETNECLPKPCRNNATCVDMLNAYKCNCIPGFEGNMCEVNIDDCKSNPCANGSTCEDLTNDYRCICSPGFTGKNCTTNIDDCAANPCKNNATCTDKINDYSCNCLPGFNGKNCEIDVNECASNPCLNKATCVDKINSYACVCLLGYEGSRCENETNECASNPCVNGTCQDLMADYRCVCTPGFTGSNCDTDIDECISNPCRNQANCTNKVNSYECTCLPGFSGPNCEIDIDECSPDPCNGNAANCTDLVNGYFCNCKPGYRGSRCETVIDFCKPNPCLHNSNCTSLTSLTTFRCDCSPGYTGKTCQIDINECLSKPCMNGGVCNDMLASYTCNCPSGFTGPQCGVNIDDCVTVNQTLPCLNGGICIDEVNKYRCRCPITHTGDKCQKAKSLKFDLRFPGGSGSYVRYANLTQTSSLTVSVWVRYSGNSSKGVFLTLTNFDSQKNYDKVLVIRESTVTVYTSGGQITHPFSKDINDGLWHHLIVSVRNDTGKLQIYQDKQLIRDVTVPGLVGRTLFGPFGELILGHEIFTNGSVSNTAFVGQLSQVGVWNRVLTAYQRTELTMNCSSNLTDTVRSWIHLTESMGPSVVKVEPTSCGRNVCPPSFIGQFCETEIDKIPPTVVSCPNATKIVSNARVAAITWTEPVFTDNKIVASVSKSHRPGQYMTWGDYIITYIAKDLFGNSATCTFEIYVMRYDCPSLKTPVNGAKICGSWDMGRFCDAKCYPGYAFSVRVAPYYSCGAGGTWSHGAPIYPNNVDNLLPSCAATAAAVVSNTNQVSYGAPSCDAAFLKSFRDEFMKKINTIQRYWPICGTSCDFSQIGIKCSTPSRKRRAVGGSPSTIVVVIPVNGTERDNYTQQVETGLKNLQFNLTVTVNNVTLNSTDNKVSSTVTTKCAKGSVLQFKNNNTCILCAAGTFHNETGNLCTDCPVGSYQNIPGSTNCTTCPFGRTTAGTGSPSNTSCMASCNSGSFFNASSNRCEICSPGYYQNSTGQTDCLPCPLEKSSNAGAKSLSECFEKCGLGSEIVTGDACQLCPKATYRDMLNQTGCMPCPYKTTTYGIGAKMSSACKAECAVGKEVTTDGKSCMDCQTGTYRSDLNSQYCVSCQNTETTKLPGATSNADCKAINETVTDNLQVRFTSEIWNDVLKKENNSEYRALASKISKAVAKVYISEPGFLSVKVKKFSPGSVIASIDLIFNKLTLNRLDPLTAAIKSGTVDTLPVDKSYNISGLCSSVVCGSSLKVCRDNGTHAKCECKAGYYQSSSLGQCQLDCQPQFCNHQGKCERGPNGRVCRCNEGYSGTNCKKERGVSIPVVVGCTIAAVVLVVFLIFLACKGMNKSSGRKSKWPLNNDDSARDSPASVRAYMNPAMDDKDYAIQLDNHNQKNASPGSARAFDNKVADMSVREDEQNDETEDSKL